MAVRGSGSWFFRIVHPTSRVPVSGTPVALVDAHGRPSGIWFSDAQGIVAIPRTSAPTVRLRVGVRGDTGHERPGTAFEFAGDDLQTGPIDLILPGSDAGDRPVESSAEQLRPRPSIAPSADDQPIGIAGDQEALPLLNKKSTTVFGADASATEGGQHPSPAPADGPTVPRVVGSGVREADVQPPHVLRFHRVGLVSEQRRDTASGDPLSDQDPVRTAGLPPVDFFSVAVNYPAPIRYGVILDFEQRWQPAGYVLGDLLFSLPLAAGDEAHVALIDRRGPAATDGGGTGLIEDIARQMAGGPLAALLAGPDASTLLGAFVLGAPVDVAEVQRIAFATAKRLAEQALRASHHYRSGRTFSVVEAHGRQSALGPTRVLRNPQPDRTLTYQYFEMLERYRVESSVTGLRPAIFVPFRMPNLGTPAAVRQYGYILRRALLDPTLADELEATLAGADPTPGGATTLTELRLVCQVSSGEAALDLWQASAVLQSGSARYQLHFTPAEAQRDRFADADVPRATRWIGTVRPVDFQRAPLRPDAPVAIENASVEDLVFERLALEGRIDGAWQRLHVLHDIVLSGQSRLQLSADVPEPRGHGNPLFAHINANLPHYAAAIVAAGDPSLRFLALAKMQDAFGAPICDVVENVVVGAIGNYIAFPLRGLTDAPPTLRAVFSGARIDPSTSAETTVAIPTPGAWLTTGRGESVSPEGSIESAEELESPPAEWILPPGLSQAG